jgi:hypothetical protein
MKNKWIYTGIIYAVAIALQLYALMFAKRDSPEMWLALSLSVLLLVIFYIKRIRYINNRNMQ